VEEVLSAIEVNALRGSRNLETDLTLALDDCPVPSKPLTALLADKLGGAKRLVQVRLSEGTVFPEASAKPRAEGLLSASAPASIGRNSGASNSESVLPTRNTISVPTLPMTADRTALV